MEYLRNTRQLVRNILLRPCTTRPGVGTSDLHPEAGQWGPELSKIKSSCLAHLWMSIEINLGSSDWLILLVTVPRSVTVGNNTLLALILASSTCLKEFKLHTVYSGILQHRKKLQLDSWTCWSSCRVQDFKFESKSKFKPLQVIGQSHPKAIREDNQRFSLQNQIKGQAHGAALLHSLGWSDGWSQTCMCLSATNAHKILIHYSFVLVEKALTVCKGKIWKHVRGINYIWFETHPLLR